eukprot:m51a1_g12153 putative orf (109) ;mRNA; f:3935-4261
MFVDELAKAGQAKVGEHVIKLTTREPVNVPSHRAGPTEKDLIRGQIGVLMGQGAIQGGSLSPYSALMLLVQKKDGSPCMVIDYRRLNTIMVPQYFPIPHIDDTLDKLR